MNDDAEKKIVDLLQEIRNGQLEIIACLTAQRALAEEQVKRSNAAVEESISLQRAAHGRYGVVLRIAFPLLAACIAMIAYLGFRYF